MAHLAGIHHVTAIAGEPKPNIEFYAGFLGLRLVKVTVNFDAPDSYHLYYGDGLGRPGTLLTFFAEPATRPGRKGAGQASIVAFAILPTAVRFWMDRLHARGLPYEGPIQRGDSAVLTFFDADDLQIELVACDEAAGRAAWSDGPLPGAYALRGLYGVTVIEEALAPTAALLTQTLGFVDLGAGPNHRQRYGLGEGSARAYVDVLSLPGMLPAKMGRGALHHVAWRAPDDAGQAAWRRTLLGAGLAVTGVLDRKYFRSIYFREPGGALFEIATDEPGFTVDEPAWALGSALQLPEHLAARRAEIEGRLPRLHFAAAWPAAPAEQVNTGEASLSEEGPAAGTVFRVDFEKR